MDANFWHERWQRGEIGFHQAAVNPLLQKYWPTFKLADSSHVLVPLAGKSRDLLWLHNQRHVVTGVELSALAIDHFFAETGLLPMRQQRGPFRASTSSRMTLLAGDIFDFSAADAKSVVAVYDRAALIALPPDLRQRYADHLGAILQPGTQSLLITIDYPAGEISGPPFAVPPSEVHALFDAAFDVQHLDTHDGLAGSDNLKNRGVTRLDTFVFKLTRRA